jgi:hypothetical protein
VENNSQMPPCGISGGITGRKNPLMPPSCTTGGGGQGIYISYAHVAMEIIRLSSTNGVSYQVCCSTHNKFQKLTGWRDRGWAGVLENQ